MLAALGLFGTAKVNFNINAFFHFLAKYPHQSPQYLRFKITEGSFNHKIAVHPSSSSFFSKFLIFVESPISRAGSGQVDTPLRLVEILLVAR